MVRLLAPIFVLVGCTYAAIVQEHNVFCDQIEGQKGMIDLADCEGTLNQYHHEIDQITDNKLSNSMECNTCQVLFEVREGYNLAIPHETAQNAIKTILSQCHSRAGSLALYRTIRGRYGGRETVIVIVRKGKDCVASQYPQFIIQPHYNSTITTIGADKYL